MTDLLGYEKHAPGGKNCGNNRNGKTTKTLKDDKGDLQVEIPLEPRRQLRSETDPQVPDALAGLRRQDHLHVRKGHEHPKVSRAISKISCRVSISPKLVSRIADTVTD